MPTDDTQPRLVPYERVPPGWEAIYTGETSSSPVEPGNGPVYTFVDDRGNVMTKWSTWTWTWLGQDTEWDDEIRHINAMQEKLGPLDDDTRQIRAHIGSSVPCEPGLPVTVDDLLGAIGRGRFLDEPLHNGCWCCGMWWDGRGTQVGSVESVQVIEDVLRAYLDGRPVEDAVHQFPQAEGFICRAYEWLGQRGLLTRVQELLLERMLLPFEFFAKRTDDYAAVNSNCFEEGGRGFEIDDAISGLAGLPKIHPNHKKEFRENLETITDAQKQKLYKLCGALAHGLHGLSDCHHSAFRWIEGWIHGIGQGTLDIPTRKAGAERERLGRLLFGYALGLDKWLLGVPMQFLLLDLGHVDLGSDPKNEILRVYAYLGGERSPTKEWLAACLWRTLTHNMGGLLNSGAHDALIGRAAQAGVSAREWMDSALRAKHAV